MTGINCGQMIGLQRLHVRVPASTSNLGPGFDFLGLAIGLFLDASASEAPDGSSTGHGVRYLGSADDGCDGAAWPPEDDLVLRSLAAYEAASGASLPKLLLTIRSEIPVGRGFGSSGAAVAATLLLAASAHGASAQQSGCGSALPREALLALALQLEGHPDNGTASLLGGLTLAVPTPNDAEGEMAIVQPPVHESLAGAVAWPDAPLFTPEARAALPETVAFADAVENPRRLALLLEGLRTGDARLLRLGVRDQLHERHRRALVHGSDAAVEAAYRAGALAACLSGAGSGVIALGPASSMERVASEMAACLRGGQGRAVPLVRSAPSVESHEVESQ